MIMISFLRYACLVNSAKSQENCSYDKLSLNQNKVAARWQGTYREET